MTKRVRIGVGTFLLIVTLLFIRHYIRVIQMGYRVEEMKKERETLVRLRNELLIERETLSLLSRIERIATEELGMTKPREGQVIFVGREKNEDGLRKE